MRYIHEIHSCKEIEHEGDDDEDDGDDEDGGMRRLRKPHDAAYSRRRVVQ